MKALDTIRSLPVEFFHKKTNFFKTVKSNPYSETEIIDSFKMISSQQEGVELTTLQNKLFEQQHEAEDCDVALEELMANCVLCFDEKPGLEECVLIKTCGHRICIDCMRDYVDSRLTNALRNAGRFPCPCCDKEIDLALMISYASSGVLLETFLRVSAERVFFNVDSYKWCPSPGCDRILKVDTETNPFGVASCGCGFKVCNKIEIVGNFD